MKSNLGALLVLGLVASQAVFAEGGIPVQDYKAQEAGISIAVESATYRYEPSRNPAEDTADFHGFSEGIYVREPNARLYPGTTEEGCIAEQESQLRKFLKSPDAVLKLEQLGVKKVVVSAYGFDDKRPGKILEPVKSGFVSPGSSTYRLGLYASRSYDVYDCKAKSAASLALLFEGEALGRQADRLLSSALNASPTNLASAKVADAQRKVAGEPSAQSVDSSKPNAAGSVAQDGR
jgi:hypothetical protein